MGDFYGTGIEFWAGLGPVGITEKKLGPIMSNFLGRFFQFFMGKINLKINYKHCSVCTKKLHKMKLIFFFQN